MIKKTSLLLIISLFLFVQSAAAANQPLYANLVKDENGKYTITEITSHKNSIDLRNLSPVGYDSTIVDCSTAFYGASKFNDNAEKCKPNPEEFRAKKTRFGPTILLGLTTFGISLLLGVIKMEGVFDYEAFDKAVAEALVNSGVSGNRAAFVERFTKIQNQTKMYDKALEEHFREYNDDYRASSNMIEKTVEDKSGFLNKDDIYFDILVKVTRKSVAELKPKPYPLPDFTASPADFNEKITEYEDELKKGFEKYTEEFEKNFKAGTSTFIVTCGPDFIKPYHLEYYCPETVPSEPAPDERFSARIVVLSKDFEGVFPLYTSENGDLKVTFTKNKVVFENKTKSVLKLRSVTVRYNGRSSVFDTSSRAASYEVMPKTESDSVIPVKKIVGYQIEQASDFAEVSKESAKTTKVKFGMEIKYSLGGDGAEQTLSGENEYTLSDLL